MSNQPFVFQLQTLHPVWRVVLGILSIGLLGFFLFFGLVMVAVFAGIALVSAAVLAIRGWWLRRRLGASARPDGEAKSDSIEGEFIVVERRSIHSRHHRD